MTTVIFTLIWVAVAACAYTVLAIQKKRKAKEENLRLDPVRRKKEMMYKTITSYRKTGTESKPARREPMTRESLVKKRIESEKRVDSGFSTRQDDDFLTTAMVLGMTLDMDDHHQKNNLVEPDPEPVHQSHDFDHGHSHSHDSTDYSSSSHDYSGSDYSSSSSSSDYGSSSDYSSSSSDYSSSSSFGD
jgi:hypothetical protein